MTLFLSEEDVRSLLDMKVVVRAVEECFKQQGFGRAVNSPRTRSAAPGSLLNVMHASLPYLGRAGVKCYLSSKEGTRFVLVLFAIDDSEPLAVMGADILGRFRTGAASAVATKYLHGGRDLGLALCGAGKQALTQVLAVGEVASLRRVRVWSPHGERRNSLVAELDGLGFEASAHGSIEEALKGADVVTTITSSKDPFLTPEATKSVAHLNLCGSNSPTKSEATPECVGSFQTVAVDDMAQSRVESGDLIGAERRGLFSWESSVELKDFVIGKARPKGRTLFKSNGVAIEDVAVASLVYDRASKTGSFRERELRF